VITGASSGLGVVFARKLAAEHDLILVARRKEKLESLAAELTAQFGCAVEVLPADLTGEQDLTVVAERIAAEPGLALLVNNAGFGARGLFWESDLKVQEQMHRLHVAATVRLSYAALRNMVARNSGGIINVASVAAFWQRGGSVSYGATKRWMTTFTEGLYLDLKSIGSAVKVQALCPGYTYTEFHDTMKLDRTKMAPPSMWLNAEFVVDESLKALPQGKLLVVPGWRYKALVALASILPNGLRVALEGAGPRR
jgi:short-subunit dehydrogenase